MSANLDLVRSIYADWERSDFRRTDWAHPQLSSRCSADQIPDGGLGFRRWRTPGAHGSEAGAHTVSKPQFRELDGGHVLVLVRGFARGKTSGVEVENLNANVLTISDGKVTRLASYNNRAEALKAVGLEE